MSESTTFGLRPSVTRSVTPLTQAEIDVLAARNNALAAHQARLEAVPTTEGSPPPSPSGSSNRVAVETRPQTQSQGGGCNVFESIVSVIKFAIEHVAPIIDKVVAFFNAIKPLFGGDQPASPASPTSPAAPTTLTAAQQRQVKIDILEKELKEVEDFGRRQLEIAQQAGLPKEAVDAIKAGIERDLNALRQAILAAKNEV
jgi:hypothetical protein